MSRELNDTVIGGLKNGGRGMKRDHAAKHIPTTRAPPQLKVNDLCLVTLCESGGGLKKKVFNFTRKYTVPPLPVWVQPDEKLVH